MIKDDAIKLICVGAGGHARAILSIFKRQYPKGQAVILDKNNTQINQDILGFKIVGTDQDIKRIYEEGYTHFIIGIGMIHPTSIREDLFAEIKQMGIKPLTIIDPSSIISENVEIGEGSVVMMGTIVNTDVKIGINTIINSGSIIEHGSIIGDHTHIAPGAIICGDVTIGDQSFVGAGSVIVQQKKLPEKSFIIQKEKNN